MREKVKKIVMGNQTNLALCQAETHTKINAIITSSFIGRVILL